MLASPGMQQSPGSPHHIDTKGKSRALEDTQPLSRISTWSSTASSASSDSYVFEDEPDRSSPDDEELVLSRAASTYVPSASSASSSWTVGGPSATSTVSGLRKEYFGDADSWEDFDDNDLPEACSLPPTPSYEEFLPFSPDMLARKLEGVLAERWEDESDDVCEDPEDSTQLRAETPQDETDLRLERALQFSQRTRSDSWPASTSFMQLLMSMNNEQ